jgi:hypothetical protein
MALRRERDEAFETGFADLDVARRDRKHASAADQIGLGAIGPTGTRAGTGMRAR